MMIHDEPLLFLLDTFPRCQEGENMFQTRWTLFQEKIQDLESVD